MVSTALYVVIFLGPKLKKSSQARPKKQEGEIALADLGNFDGVEERSAYIAYNGKIYDMTESDLWKNGLHVKRHKAGEDLTDMLKQAPHGEEKVLEMPLVGELDLSKKDEKPLQVKVFYFLAYFNLGAVFLITLILALWQWW
jgi:predicted heme/steroid binding protein